MKPILRVPLKNQNGTQQIGLSQKLKPTSWNIPQQETKPEYYRISKVRGVHH